MPSTTKQEPIYKHVPFDWYCRRRELLRVFLPSAEAPLSNRA